MRRFLLTLALVAGQASLGVAQLPADLVRQVELGQDRQALSQLASHDDAEANYLRGRLLERQGRLQEAVAAYESEMPSLVAEDALRRRGRLLARSGDCVSALPLLEAQRDPISRAARAECLARSAESDEDKEAARAALRQSIERDAARVDTYSLRQTLAEITPDEAAQIRRAAQVAHPLHPDVTLDANGDWTLDERIQLAERFRRASRPTEALAILGSEPRTRRAEWLHVRGMCLYATRDDYAEAAEVLRRAWRLGGPTAIDDRFHAARALSRADEDRAAIRAYDALVRAHRRHRRARQAAYLAAWLEIRLNATRGRARMTRFLNGPLARGRYRRDAAWDLGLEAFERRSFTSARRHFSAYLEASEDAVDEAKALYWRGRAHAEGGHASQARRDYERAAQRDPLSWYALLACRRLSDAGHACPELGDPSPEAAELELAIPERAQLFVRIGLREDALASLRSAERELRQRAPRGRVNEALARLYTVVGGTTRAFRLAALDRRRLAMRPAGGARWAWEAAYPRPYFEHVQAESALRGVAWEHVYATMRQESSFDEAAFSQAGAIGLLQLMPDSARSHARREGWSFTPERLYEPEWNVRFGVVEIAEHIQRFESAPLAIAAYNAGAARVERWLREQETRDLDLFVERIPFNETRRYVRRVVGHMAHYRYLHDQTIFTLATYLGVHSE
ncbi:MAG: transglycosylase SLT domain-containing protein [Polyangiales bacterium]